jgi:hypothetical protein
MDIDREALKGAVELAYELELCNDSNDGILSCQLDKLERIKIKLLVALAQSVIDGTIFASEGEMILEIACVVKSQDVLDFEWTKKIAHALSHKIPAPSSAMTREELVGIIKESKTRGGIKALYLLEVDGVENLADAILGQGGKKCAEKRVNK